MSVHVPLPLTPGFLARRGFGDSGAALRVLGEPALAGFLRHWGPDPAAAGDAAEELVDTLAAAGDPDSALRAVARLAERPGSPALALLRTPGEARDRLVAVLGGSSALADGLVRHPGDADVLAEPDEEVGEAALRAALLSGVGADPASPAPVAAAGCGPDDLRRAYRRRLLSLAGRDLADPEPDRRVGAVSRELADLAAAALEAALALARAQVGPAHAQVRLAVVGMGKCGGRELNYVSDVDVIFVAEPAEGVEEAEALTVATRLARLLSQHCSAWTAEGTLWPVDAALRPEGKNGPLVRTVASHGQYYERWASTWEFQALLKARHVAGDAGVAAAYLDAVRPLVWSAAQRQGFVADVQEMRRRVESRVKDGQRQLKLGPGGLRDVEFSVQLLQLVHGRADERLRAASTLEGLEALATYGYVGISDAGSLDRAYRWLRVLEHRLQLVHLTRTHVLPGEPAELDRLARTVGAEGVSGLERRWRQTSGEVRRLHERLFYRPVLAAAARLSPEDARLGRDAARARLEALGYRDPVGALRHLEALTAGVSRRAAIQRQLLPVLLGWFADGADPDAGLLSFRRLSEALGTTPWYLRMLRDDGAAAERLANLVTGSRLAADLLLAAPEAARWLEGDADLVPRRPDALRAEVAALLSRHPEPAGAAAAVRAVRRREMTRTAVGDLSGVLDLGAVGEALSGAAQVVLEGVLAVALRTARERRGGPLPVRMAVIGMGRLGGREISYTSDADVLLVFDPEPGAGEAEAASAATAVVGDLRRLLQTVGPEPPLELDTGLRPEGRQGPVVRSLAAYAEYYRRWSAPWEAQALVRAAPVAGDPALGEAFCELVEPVRHPTGGLDEQSLRELRRVKARVESERLPRGVDPRRHVKLGPGGLADVEWTVQLLQLQHSGRVRALRTTSTLAALEALREAALVDAEDAAVLEEAWRWGSRVRAAVVLWRGRDGDVLPTDRDDLEGIARLLGYPAASAAVLEEEHRRRTRHARGVVERLFYG